MNNRIFLMITSLACIVGQINAAEKSPLAGALVRITESSYKQLNGKQALIYGDSQEILGIKDVWSARESFGCLAILMYRSAEPTPPFSGNVYCGEVDGEAYCFHESWLQKVAVTEHKKTNKVDSTTN